MKRLPTSPLWNAPSLGTISLAGAWLATAVHVYGPPFFFTLLFVAPLGPVFASAWRKRPAWLWRGGAALTVFTALVSTVSIPPPFPQSPELPPHADASALVYHATAAVNAAVVAEIPLILFALITIVHTRSQRKT